MSDAADLYVQNILSNAIFLPTMIWDDDVYCVGATVSCGIYCTGIIEEEPT